MFVYLLLLLDLLYVIVLEKDEERIKNQKSNQSERTRELNELFQLNYGDISINMFIYYVSVVAAAVAVFYSVVTLKLKLCSGSLHNHTQFDFCM